MDSNLAKVTVTASGWRAHKPRDGLIAAGVWMCTCMRVWASRRMCVRGDRNQLIAEGAAWEQAVS